MKPEEAIEILKLMQAQVEWDYPMDYAAVVDMAIDALEKQIPMELMQIHMSETGKYFRPCGNCGDDPGRGDFCQWCGQAVKRC